MGFDLALGGLVLIMAIRGWLRGFVLQAIRLGGLVACVYAADPVRDLAKPHVLAHLPAIRPDLVDRLLWWSSVVVSYVVLVGLATLVVNLQRRQPFGLTERDRTDQAGGMMLGLAKGLVVAAFLAAGVEKYALGSLRSVPFADEQAKGSRVLLWNERYHPVARIWSLAPVQSFVNRVQQRGLTTPSASLPAPDPLQTASRTPRLSLPASPDVMPIDSDVAEAVEAIKKELGRGSRPN